MQLLSQHDPRWNNQILGYNTPNSIYTIGGFGCLITCLAMIAGTDPLTLNNQLKNIGGYQAFGGFYIWGKINQLYNINESQVQKTSDIERVKNEIRAGKICILQVDYNPRTVAWDMHFVIAHKLNGEKLVIIDPIDGKEKLLENSYRSFKTYTSYTILTADVVRDKIITINNNQDMELKNQMKNIIATDSRYDEETRRMLLAAIDNNDMAYVLAFSGAFIRDELKSQQYKKGELELAYNNLLAEHSKVETTTQTLENLEKPLFAEPILVQPSEKVKFNPEELKTVLNEASNKFNWDKWIMGYVTFGIDKWSYFSALLVAGVAYLFDIVPEEYHNLMVYTAVLWSTMVLLAFLINKAKK